MSKPFLSATLICKDEKHHVRQCLNSIWDAVDEIVMVDTGSKDGTLGEALSFAKSKRQASKLKTATFKWCDDFAAARQHADSLATGDWLVWLDLDDVVVGLDQLREYALDASDEVTAFFCHYDYARDENGNSISELWRERVVRNNGTRWQGRLHEHKQIISGAVVQVSPDVASWVHMRDHAQRTGDRNTRILEAWLADEPDNPRVIASLAMEHMGSERYEDGARLYERFLGLPDEPKDHRMQAFRRLCQMLLVLNRPEDARDWAFQALQEEWLWADTHLTLAEVEHTLGRPDRSLVHAQTALQLGKPTTMLIVNPLQYTAHAHTLVGLAHAGLGRWQQAVEHGMKALEIAPSFPLALQQLPLWRAQLKKQRAVGAFTSLADVLVEAGEVEKASKLLDFVPWYASSRPEIVQKRAHTRRLFDERLTSPASLPEDPAADKFIKRHKEAIAA